MELVYHSPLKHPDNISYCIYISLYQSLLSSLYCMSGFTGIETPVWFAHLWLISLQTGVKFHFLPGSPGNTPPLTCVILCIRVAVHLKLASVAFIANGAVLKKCNTAVPKVIGLISPWDVTVLYLLQGMGPWDRCKNQLCIKVAQDSLSLWSLLKYCKIR